MDEAWARANGLTEPLAFSHNLGSIFTPELHATRPEFYPLVEGKRLQPVPGRRLFWNPDIAREDVAEYAAEAARRFFVARPNAPSFPLGMNDGLVWGESPELLALTTPTRWFRERPDYTRLVFTFLNRAAERLEKSRPQKYLGALAYYWAEQAPEFPVHPQVVPFLTADRSQGYDAAFLAEDRALQERWLAALQAGRRRYAPAAGEALPPLRIGIYDYNEGSGFLVPRVFTRLLSEHIAYVARLGYTDYFSETNAHWGLDGPMPWLTAQLLADPTQSSTALLDEYYARFFGPASDSMRRYFERCEQQWMAQGGAPYWLKYYRNEAQAALFPSAVCRELRALLEAARQQAQGSPRYLARVDLVRAAFGMTERLVALYETRTALVNRSTRPADSAPGEIATDLLGYLRARREFVAYTYPLSRVEPLAAPTHMEWPDYLANDPVGMALLAMRESRGNEAAERAWADVRELEEYPRARELWAQIRFSGERVAPGSNRPAVSQGIEILSTPDLDGATGPARTIADLTYGIALPPPWSSTVEPAQHHEARVITDGGERRLRIQGTRDTAVFQWTRFTPGALHVASLRVRGKVSASCAVTLGIAWTDEGGKRLKFRNVRLPAGEWVTPATLQQTDLPPSDATWVGWGLRVTNQTGDDFVEFSALSLKGH